ncbi:hypothetical protein [Candidatus Nitrospira bockiana]
MKTRRDIGWWYWLVTIVLLVVGLTGRPWGGSLAIALCVVQLAHFFSRERSVSAFPVQVRLVYLGLLLAGQWAPLGGLYWLMAVGTAARVLANYCLLARLLLLAPWNRLEPMSARLLRRVLLSPRAPSCSGAKEEGWELAPAASR